MFHETREASSAELNKDCDDNSRQCCWNVGIPSPLRWKNALNERQCCRDS